VVLATASLTLDFSLHMECFFFSLPKPFRPFSQEGMHFLGLLRARHLHAKYITYAHGGVQTTTFPVPMAHTGSYATTTPFQLPAKVLKREHQTL